MTISIQSRKPAKQFATVTWTMGPLTTPVSEANGRATLRLEIPKTLPLSTRRVITAARRVITLAKQNGLTQLAVDLAEWQKIIPTLETTMLLELLAREWTLANYEFTKYKSKASKKAVRDIIVIGAPTATNTKALRQGTMIAKEINACRDLCNTPGSDMTPQALALAAQTAVAGTSITVKILNTKAIADLKMNGILAVAKGSNETPHLIVMEYHGGLENDKPIVLIGKGVTFDTGGINIKPTDGLGDMYMDMSGGAAVIHAIVAAAKLKLPKNIVAIVPAVENMISGNAYRPGDIITMMSGKTVEVGNTDAEGRLVLADALTYAERYQPRLVVDVATLTGAALVALGQKANALFTRDQELESRCRHWGEVSGDYVWPLPLWDEYENDIKGQFADISNVGTSGRMGGAITAAIFLYQFAKKFPWVHLDIAPRMTSIDGDHLAKGASGTPIRLLIELLRHY